MGVALQAACRAAREQIMHHRSRITASDPESLHQIRVGLRHLDTVIRYFSASLPKDKRIVLAGELKWFGRALSRAREIDVFLDEVISRLPHRDRLKPDIAMIERLCRQTRKREYDHVRKTLVSRRFQVFLSAVGSLLIDGKGLLCHDSADPQRAAVERLETARAKLREGRRIDKLGRHRLHHFRLRTKRMRYAIGFVAPLFEGKNAKALQRAGDLLKRLQDELGTVTDRRAHVALLKELQRTSARGDGVGEIDWRGAKHLLFAKHRKMEDAALKRAVKIYRKFAKADLR